ncbi:MAG: TAXI family TRAP transporter solute-binding subunit [Thermoprotei archaeon]|jgi:TRAP transporter TAXI family solute receptor
MFNKRGISRIFAIVIIVVIIVAISATIYSVYYSGAPATSTTPTMSTTTSFTTSPSQIVKITWTSGSTGGAFYLSTAAALAAIGNPDSLVFIHQAGSGGTTGILLLKEGMTDIGVGSLLDAQELYKNFASLRVILPVAAFAGQLVVRADSDIKSWSDVNGKAISIGSPTFIANKMFKNVMQVLNIKPSVIKELGHTDSMDQLVSGIIDAYFFTGFPNPTVQEYAIKYKLKLVPPTTDELKIITQKLPYYQPYTIDASGGKVYSGIDIKFDTIADWAFHYTTSKLSEDIVYMIVKTYWTNKKTAESLFLQHKDFKPSILFLSKPIPLHAGVIKYYKEINVTVPPELIPPEYKS